MTSFNVGDCAVSIWTTSFPFTSSHHHPKKEGNNNTEESHRKKFFRNLSQLSQAIKFNFYFFFNLKKMCVDLNLNTQHPLTRFIQIVLVLLIHGRLQINITHKC
jgi:hypothetical protein